MTILNCNWPNKIGMNAINISLNPQVFCLPTNYTNFKNYTNFSTTKKAKIDFCKLLFIKRIEKICGFLLI